MKNLILLICLAIFSQTAFSDVYLEVGIGLDDSFNSKITESRVFYSPLAKFAVGYEFEYNWNLEFEHISSIPNVNDRYGLNVIWLSKRLYF